MTTATLVKENIYWGFLSISELSLRIIVGSVMAHREMMLEEYLKVLHPCKQASEKCH